MGHRVLLVALLLCGSALPSFAKAPNTTAFTYQGKLENAGVAYTGSGDFRFVCYDAASGGVSFGPSLQLDDVVVSDGVFTVTLDFGSVFSSGSARWIEIGVRTPHDPSDSQPFQTLAPRQPVTSTPVAQYALSGGSGHWVQNGAAITNSNSGFVGVNRSAAITPNEVFGVNSYELGDNVYGGMYVSMAGSGGSPFYGYATGGLARAWTFYQGTTGNWKLFNNGERLTVTGDNGYVGIGTNEPLAKLHVAGEIHSSNTAGFNLTFPSGDTFDIASRDGSTTQRLLRMYKSGTAPGIILEGANLAPNVYLTSVSGFPNNGYVGVGDATGTSQASMTVNSLGQGVVTADVKNFRVPHPNDATKEIVYASVEGPEAAMYVRGTARLEDGRARVDLPEHFRVLALEKGMTVQLTPRSAESMGMAVVERAPDHFEVRELMKGRGSYEFDWEVKAVRRGHEDYEPVRPKEWLKAAVVEGSR